MAKIKRIGERVVHYKLGNAKLELIPNWQGD